VAGLLDLPDMKIKERRLKMMIWPLGVACGRLGPKSVFVRAMSWGWLWMEARVRN